MKKLMKLILFVLATLLVIGEAHAVSCSSKYTAELKKLKQAVNNIYKQGYAECLQNNSSRFSDQMESSGYSLQQIKKTNCGDPSWDETSYDNYIHGTDEYKEYAALKDLDPEKWCSEQ